MPKPPFVIHVDEMDQHPNAVYIGRHNGRRKLNHSRWGNPFSVKRHGRDGAIRLYRNYITKEPWVVEGLVEELSGKPLACWCRHSHEERTADNACHGDVLVELWKEVTTNATD